MTTRRKVLIVTTLSSAALLLTLGLLEMGARLLGFYGVPRAKYILFFVPDPERGYACRPDSHFDYLGTHRWVRANVDAQGFRPILCGQDQTQSPIVVCLGDSTTFSRECADGETWPEAASRGLARLGVGCRFWNCGMGGYSGVQSLATLRQVLRDPVRAPFVRGVIYHFCMNDPTENYDGSSLPRPTLDPKEFGEEGRSVESVPHRIIPPRAMPDISYHPTLKQMLVDRCAFLAAISWAKRAKSEAEFKKGAEETCEVFSRFCGDFVAKVQFREGMRFVLHELVSECKRKTLPLFVSFHVIPAWDGDESSRRDVLNLTGMAPEKFQDQMNTYQASCELLKKMTEEVGATFIDLRHCLDGLTHREYACAPADWHHSGIANERIGAAVANKVFSAVDWKR